MAGQWTPNGAGGYKRFIQSTQMTGYGSSGNWENVSGLKAVQLGLMAPSSLTGMDKWKYDTDRRYRQQVDAAGAATSAGQAGGGLSSPYKEILDRAQAEQDRANASNESRYQQALGLSDTMLQTSEGMGQQERADIQSEMSNAYSRGLQSVVSSGLSNSMLKPALMASQAKNTSTAFGRLNDRLKATKLDILRNKQGVIASKVDEGPNQGLYAQLIQSIGAGGLGARGGGAGGYGGYSFGGGARASTSRARPWSPNWNMNQGMNYRSAVSSAFR